VFGPSFQLLSCIITAWHTHTAPSEVENSAQVSYC